MPATAIDMFFACTLMVTVALVATAFLAGTIQVQIENTQNLNQESYLRSIADNLVKNFGSPTDWGSTNSKPTNLGLSATTGTSLYTLDVDKITRFNTQNTYALSYVDALSAAKIDNIAVNICISQMLSIDTKLLYSNLVDDSTAYTFEVTISQDTGTVSANLHCYALAQGTQVDVFNSTTNDGVSSVTVEIPNSASGPAILVVFAQASFDERFCAYTVHKFTHSSIEPEETGKYLNLSPLDNELNINLMSPQANVGQVFACSYNYSAILTSASSNKYVIPDFVDNSPIVIIAEGFNETTYFNEWVAYPQVPFTFGSNLANSSTNAFSYIVNIKDVLYKFTIKLGDVSY
ncbi:MAG: hypothetical protein GX638_03950 [Crenarchaeota archaeon]|nr:hypothetical protein [Thermoproteota archaeon]